MYKCIRCGYSTQHKGTFIRHIERTRLLIHLVDGGAEDPLKDLIIVETELAAYGHGLMDRPRLIVLNKRELLSVEEQASLVKSLEEKTGKKLFLVSAVLDHGLKELMSQVWDQLEI